MRRRYYYSVDASDVGFGICCVLFGGLVIGLLGLLAHGINTAVVATNVDIQNDALDKQRQELGKQIGDKFGLRDFDLASLEFSTKGDKTLVKAFGAVKQENFPGVFENKYINVMFNVPSADAYRILDALSSFQEIPSLKKDGSPENKLSINEKGVHAWKFSENKRVNEAGEKVQKVYEQLRMAVASSTLVTVEDIHEASQLNNAISQVYRYMRPEVLGDTQVGGWFAHGSTTFINAGVMTTSVSQVVNDEEKGISYFFVDTIQGREINGDIKPVSCRLRVEVEGNELSQEEVYKKFIYGQYSQVVEVIRTEDSAKTGVAENELNQNVDEIELM